MGKEWSKKFNYDIMWKRITCNQPKVGYIIECGNVLLVINRRVGYIIECGSILLVINLCVQRKDYGRQRDKKTAI